MKMSLLMIALFSGILTLAAPAKATDVIITAEKQFIGNYELVDAIKESKATMSNRASKCRDVLHVFLGSDKSLLHLRGEDNNGVGLTLNWIENQEGDGISTELGEGSLKQSRLWSGIEVLGVQRTVKLVTSLKKVDDVLIYKYRNEIHNEFLNSDTVNREAICIYKKLR